MSESAIQAVAQVSESRLWDRLMELGRIGALPDGGVCRHALSIEDVEARALLINLAVKHGFSVSTDRAANLWIRREGRDPTSQVVVSGSHLDTQPAGGKFDGAYGVLAGLEALVAMEQASVRCRRPIDIVAWTNEEGGRFERGSLGSSVWSGSVRLEDCVDDIGLDGARLGDALDQVYAASPHLPTRPDTWPASAYVEAHIEQGPLLEAESVSVGVVTGIQGAMWLDVTITGHSGHAGTIPPALRRDAFQAATRAVTSLNELMDDPTGAIRFTIGRIVVEPNSASTIPGSVSFSIDFRHPDGRVLDGKGSRIHTVIEEAVAPCDVEVELQSLAPPARFSESILNIIESSSDALGLRHRRLPSGAFHDAWHVAKVCPTGMIFIPCREGISHHPDEWASTGDCANGARVLAAVLVELACE